VCVINLDPRFISAVREGRKTATIRLGRRDYNTGWALLKIKTNNIPIQIQDVRHCRLVDLTDTDARRDGFSSLNELFAALREFYPYIQLDDEVTIVFFAVKRGNND
jgi:hypothetical protein